MRQKQNKTPRTPVDNVAAGLKAAQRQMGKVALAEFRRNNPTADLFQALGSLYGEYFALQQQEHAKVISMASAIEWIKALTGLSTEAVLAELTRRAQEKVNDLAAMEEPPERLIQ